MILDRLKKLIDALGCDHDHALTTALAYLRHYGYLAGAVESLAVDDATAIDRVIAALRAFQRIAGLGQHGFLDAATQQMMAARRCGCLDVQRDSLAEAKWRKNALTYAIRSYVGGLSDLDQHDLIQLAWADWSAVANITVAMTSDLLRADIIIDTGRGAVDGFDGPSGTLAYAYMPTGLDQQLLMRFDLDEVWLKESGAAGVLFKNVATHEFGHLIGLTHSQVPTALMAPFYSVGVSRPQANDDIPRIRALYGAAGGQTPPPPPSDKFKVVLAVEGRKVTVEQVG